MTGYKVCPLVSEMQVQVQAESAQSASLQHKVDDIVRVDHAYPHLPCDNKGNKSLK